MPAESTERPNESQLYGDKAFLICEICYQVIGTVDLNNVYLPLKGSMFGSQDPVHGYPPPFDPNATFLDMNCPLCRHRFATEENMIRTDRGFVEVQERNEKTVHIVGAQDSQGDAEVACLAHTQDGAGSIPAPATKKRGGRYEKGMQKAKGKVKK